LREERLPYPFLTNEGGGAMAQKKSRQTFEKLKREQAVKEKRALKQERKKAAKLAKGLGEPPVEPEDGAGLLPDADESPRSDP
jgi:hypothetical protein